MTPSVRPEETPPGCITELVLVLVRVLRFGSTFVTKTDRPGDDDLRGISQRLLGWIWWSSRGF